MESPLASSSLDAYYFGMKVAPSVSRQQLPEVHMFPYTDTTPCNACRSIKVEALISAAGHRLHTVAEATFATQNGCGLCGLILRNEMSGKKFDPHTEMLVMRVGNTIGVPFAQDIVEVLSETLPMYSDVSNPVRTTFHR